MSGKKKAIIAVAVIGVIAVLVGMNLKQSNGKEVEVTAETVKKETITSTVTGTGKIQPETDVSISAYVTGEITKLGVKEGDHVVKGQFLCQLDRTKYEAALQQNKALHKSALANARLSKANLTKTEKELERAKQLFERNLMSGSEYDQYKANFEVAKAQHEANLDLVSQRQASVDEAEDNLNKTRLVAPMDGTIAQLNSEEGEVVLGTGYASGTIIMTVADLNKMEVLAEIDENDIVHVELGDEVDIDVDAFPDTLFRGKVSEISNTAITRGLGTQEEVTNFTIKVSVMDKILSLRPGMSSTVEVKTETHDDVVAIPIQCITVRKPLKKDKEGDEELVRSTDGDSSKEKNEDIEVVFVIRDGVAHQVPVKTGISDDTKIEILEGLKEGDQIVTGSFRTLSKTIKDGDAVQIKKKQAGRPDQKNED